MATETKEIIHGCSFLVEDHPLDLVFTREDFDEEQRMIGDLMKDFVAGSIEPRMDELEANGQSAQRIVLGDWYTRGSVLRVTPDGYELTTI